MKYHKLIFIFTVINCTLVLVSNSQVLTENPPSNNQTTQNNSTTVINQEPKRSDKPFLGTDVPIFNPGTEVFSWDCLLYTSPSPRDISGSRMPSSA